MRPTTRPCLTPTRPATLACTAFLAVAPMVAPTLAQSDPAPATPPSPSAPEAPRPNPADAYQQLPEVARQMIDSASGSPSTPAAVTPVAHVETRGTGPKHVVLVPGIACDWSVWDAFMTRNAERFTMHAVTLPGFAGSAAPPMPDADKTAWSSDVWMLNARRAVSAAIASRELATPPIVVGHSMGAQVALRLATEEPERVSAVVMVDGFAAWPLTPTPIPLQARQAMVDNQMAGFFDTQLAANDAAGLRQMFRTGVIDAARAEALVTMSKTTPTEVFKRYFLELVSADHTPGLKTIAKPVLVMAAVAPAPPPVPPGQPAPPDTRETLRTVWRTQFEGLDRVQLEFIEGARHFIMDDAPERFDALIATFSDSLKPALPEPASPEKPSTGGTP
ncbi:MAG: alpha/beta fold hydrolase [Phycisphaerales bacterium]